MSTSVDSKSTKEKVKNNDDEVFVLDDVDDVPGDFFDDFLKEDFMAGLDIVDDDQWENGEFKKVSKPNLEDVNKKTKEDVKKTVDDKKRKKDKRANKSDNKNKSKEIDSDDFDIRRDPTKTKRDIERNKAKVVKDQAQKLITEKLKLVETGLVPPGMEMEVDLNEIRKEKNIMVQSEVKIVNPTKRKRSPLKSGSPRRRPSPRKRSPNRQLSPYGQGGLPKRSPRSPLRRSPLRRSPPRRSPLRRSHDRFPAERRSRDRSSRERRQRDLVPRLRDRRSRGRSSDRTFRPARRSRSISPFHDRRLRLSPDYMRRRRRSRSRSRDKRSDAKKSFLQEIVEKLRGAPSTHSPASMGHQFVPEPHMQPSHPMQGGPPMQTVPSMQPIHSVPPHLEPMLPLMRSEPPHLPVNPGPIQPVPPPTFPIVPQQPIHPPVQAPIQNQYDPYDQSFFIGTPQQLNFPPPQAQQPPLMPSQAPFQNAGGGGGTKYSGPTQSPQKTDIPAQDVEKLFHGKKITLSEYLAITAKSEGNPVQLKDKIKVLSRCHDAIKILDMEEKKFQGRLQLKKSTNTLTPKNTFKSPLVKLAETKISFTELPSKEKHKSAFSTQLNNLLKNIGLLDDVVELDDEPEPILSKIVQKDSSPPPPPHISRQRPPKRPEDPPIGIHIDKYLSKMCQTEPSKCADCEKRKKIVYKTVECQTGELMTYSVSTQVTEEDLVSKIPKNQSLASLTPAQLLAQSGGGSSSKRYLDSNDFDIYPPKMPFGRGNYESQGMRFVPPDRDRFESSGSQFTAGRGRGPSSVNYDLGPRYSYY